MEKLNKDQVVRMAVALFREADQLVVDEAVAEARRQFAAEQVEIRGRRRAFDELFDYLIALLKERGVPEYPVKLLEIQREDVWEKRNKTEMLSGSIPFLPVIPLTYRSIFDLMATVRDGEKIGKTELDPKTICDNVETPDAPYYIYGVETGETTENMAPGTAENFYNQHKLSPLSVAELIALAIHTDVLSRHNLWTAGSHHSRTNRITRGSRPMISSSGVGQSRGENPQPVLCWLVEPTGLSGSAACVR